MLVKKYVTSNSLGISTKKLCRVEVQKYFNLGHMSSRCKHFAGLAQGITFLHILMGAKYITAKSLESPQDRS